MRVRLFLALILCLAIAGAAPVWAAASCASEVGPKAAQKLVAACINVSPATHPPCNAANSCAMIKDEIARSCALFDDGHMPPQCAPGPRSQTAAVEVVRLYYEAINARDFATAWQQWGDHGVPNQTYANFAHGYAQTKRVRVTIGTLQPAEGGAGSIYQDVPVTVDAVLKNGKRQRFSGSYVVRRVNGVDGGSPGQLRWHIDSAHLRAQKLQ